MTDTESVICLDDTDEDTNEVFIVDTKTCEVISLIDNVEQLNSKLKNRKLRKIKQKRLKIARRQHYQQTCRLNKLNCQRAPMNLQKPSTSFQLEDDVNSEGSGIPMIVVDTKGTMTNEKADIIQNTILLAVNKASDTGETIQFFNSKYNPTSYLLTFLCANRASQKWLSDTVNSISDLWEGWQLRAQYNEFQKVSIFIWWEAEDPFVILNRLQVQNPDLDVYKWIYLHSTVAENTINLFLGVPTDILPKLADLNYTVFYGINAIEIHLRQTG